jgi:dTDP-4-dehydrorhamnose reductase
MRVLLLGGNGQVGWELRRALAPLGEVVVLGRAGTPGAIADFDPPDRAAQDADLEKPDPLRLAVRRTRPEVIVNAAAYTDVDRAESEPDRAARVNAEAPALLAAEAKQLDAWLVHYSTDYVFDGSGTRPWTEDDATAPINVYGRSKWEGEEAIRRAGCRYLILRTQWIYSARRRNFLRTILAAAAARPALEVVDDQVGAPTGADLVADVTAQMLRSVLSDATAGTYHVAARGETTWCGYARFAIEHARRAGWPLALTENAIAPITSEARPSAAKRPRNGRLAVDRLERKFGLRMPDWRPGILRALAELGPEAVRDVRAERAPLEQTEPAT